MQQILGDSLSGLRRFQIAAADSASGHPHKSTSGPAICWIFPRGPKLAKANQSPMSLQQDSRGNFDKVWLWGWLHTHHARLEVPYHLFEDIFCLLVHDLIFLTSQLPFVHKCWEGLQLTPLAHIPALKFKRLSNCWNWSQSRQGTSVSDFSFILKRQGPFSASRPVISHHQTFIASSQASQELFAYLQNCHVLWGCRCLIMYTSSSLLLWAHKV